MARKNKKSIIKQAEEQLTSKLRIGESKLAYKKKGMASEYIFSWNTYRTYLKHACYFLKWAKETHGCKTLESARPYADEWLKSRSELSAYTCKLEVAALAKLYDCGTKEFIKTQSRERKNIKRSRNEVVRDKNFSEHNNSELVHFCKHTGVRRSELSALRGNQLFKGNDGNYYIHIKGKGGRVRNAPILNNDELVIRRMQQAGDGKVFESVHNGADIHSYRAEYCTAIYRKHARDLNTLPRDQIYYCRGDMKGRWLDKQAMLIASRALGHNRIDVIAGHYLRLETDNN